MIYRRQLDRRLHADLAQFCAPPRAEDLPLCLAEGVATRFCSSAYGGKTEDLIAEAKRRCPPLAASINSRAFALAILIVCTSPSGGGIK